MHDDTPNWGPALNLALFGLGLMLTPARGLLLHTLPHALHHPGCVHPARGRNLNARRPH